jgi:hypothetical protein
VAGQRYKSLNGKEIEKGVQDDPFKTAKSSRQKRSPDFFENVRQKAKELFERVKKFFGVGQQTDGGDGQQGQEGKGSRVLPGRNTVTLDQKREMCNGQAL